MGTKRVEGKKKRKSIKTKVTSRSSQEKRLSRMGKKIKKGLMGPSTDFMTRSAVLKKLQITLKDFRRLCILKGIYPRVPPKPLKGADKVYYDIKDIAYLAHEPLLHKFRTFKAFMKKIRREAGRYEFDEARRRNEYKPVMRLDHLVKERYPRFIDALRDMDDTLCMIHLFAALPSTGRITAERVHMCQTLVKHWQYYVARSRCLTKSFFSIKGAYFQVEILGEAITWLEPHPFPQHMPRDVDFRVMLTFLEFYEVFMKFVLFKLYNRAGWRYPPQEDAQLQQSGCFLLALRAAPVDEHTSLENVSKNSSSSSNSSSVSNSKAVTRHDPSKLQSLAEKLDALAANQGSNKASKSSKVDNENNDDDDDEEDDDEDDDGAVSGVITAAFHELYETQDASLTPWEVQDELDPTGKGMFNSDLQPQEGNREGGDSSSRGHLFQGLKFFINKEVPLPWMQLVVISQGGQVGWEGPGSPYTAQDPSITHHVVDRPTLAPSMTLLPAREFIQPQWIIDSLNAQLRLPTKRYGMGVKLPPHLSPFVTEESEGYLPRYQQEIQAMKKRGGSVEGAEEDNANADEEEEDEDPEEEDDSFKKPTKTVKEDVSTSKKNSNRKGAQVHNQTKEKLQDDQSEEKSVVKDTKKGGKAIVFKPETSAAPKQTEEEEAQNLSKVMMSRKTKRLYDNMKHSNQAKQAVVDKLHQKRKRIEEQEDQKQQQSNSSQSQKGKKARK